MDEYNMLRVRPNEIIQMVILKNSLNNVSKDKQHHKRDIFWHSNFWIIVTGIIAVISFIRAFDIHGIPALPKNRKSIEVVLDKKQVEKQELKM